MQSRTTAFLDDGGILHVTCCFHDTECVYAMWPCIHVYMKCYACMVCALYMFYLIGVCCMYGACFALHVLCVVLQGWNSNRIAGRFLERERECCRFIERESTTDLERATVADFQRVKIVQLSTERI